MAIAGAGVLGERVVGRQVVGIAVYVTGAALFFWPAGFASATAIGLAAAGVGLVANAGAWGLVAWLAAVNTPFAFTLWNASLHHLSAVASSVVNNTMLVQIALLAWVFLGEALDARQGIGIALAALGALVAQVGPAALARAWRGSRRRRSAT